MDDIKEHLPLLMDMAAACGVVVEFGVRYGHSTQALLESACPVVESWDIEPMPQVIDGISRIHPRWKFHAGSSADADIPECDMLFIDSRHTGPHLLTELVRHHRKVRRWIVMHDTETYATTGDDGEPGLWMGLTRFLLDRCAEWRIKAHYSNNNGLTVLERVECRAS